MADLDEILSLFDVGPSGFQTGYSEPIFGGLNFFGAAGQRPYWELSLDAGAQPYDYFPQNTIVVDRQLPTEPVLSETQAVDPAVPVINEESKNMDFTTVGQVDDLGSLFGAAIGTLGSYLQQQVPNVYPGGAPVTIYGSPGGQASITVNARNCPVGFHQPKNYGKRGGSTKPCVRNRHMNVLNPKALMRATRRLGGFYHFAKKTEKLIQKSFSKAGIHGTRRIASKCGTCRKTRCSC